MTASHTERKQSPESQRAAAPTTTTGPTRSGALTPALRKASYAEGEAALAPTMTVTELLRATEIAMGRPLTPDEASHVIALAEAQPGIGVQATVKALTSVVQQTEPKVDAAKPDAPKADAPKTDAPKTTSGKPAPTRIEHSFKPGTPGTARKPVEPTHRDTDILHEDELSPLNGALVGPEMLIADNAESFSFDGLIASTMGPDTDAPKVSAANAKKEEAAAKKAEAEEKAKGGERMPDRGAVTHDFVGSARIFSLANNRTGNPLRNSIVVQNRSDKPVAYTLCGIVYGQHVTKTDGKVPPSYARNGKFQGPQAVAGAALMNAEPDPKGKDGAGKNGFFEKVVVVPAGKSVALNDVYQEKGSEVCTCVTVVADDPKAVFRLANAVTPKSLEAWELEQIARGEFRWAGDATKKADPKDEEYKGADANRLGRPSGVAKGSVMVAAREVALTAGAKKGDIVMTTKLRNAGGAQEAAPLTNMPKNPKGYLPPAATNDGNYGVTYKVDYTLVNSDEADLDVEVWFTAPAKDKDTDWNPDGGILTMPIDVGSQRVYARVQERGQGLRVAQFTLKRGQKQALPVSFTNMGNIFPPAGFEFRAKKAAPAPA